jgi:hypothetical protein
MLGRAIAVHRAGAVAAAAGEALCRTCQDDRTAASLLDEGVEDIALQQREE